jgi:hypothetical protein
MRAMILTAVVALAACEPAVEVSLSAAPDDSPHDLSCVNVVQVIVQGNAPEDRQTVCLHVEPGTVRSLNDHNLDGLLDVPIPKTGLDFMAVVGMTSPIDDCSIADTIFHGAASYDGGDQLAIRLHHDFDCANAAPTTRDVFVVDQTALITTGECVPAAEGWFARAGYIMPLRLEEPGVPASQWSPFVTPEPPGAVAAGHGSVTFGFTAAEEDTCLAVSVDRDSGTEWTTSCVAPGTRTACAPSGAVEVGYMPFAELIPLEDSGDRLWGTTMVTVWDGAERRVVTGAEILLDDPDAELSMVNLDGTHVVEVVGELSGARTTSTGSFLVRSSAPLVATIKVPGYGTRNVRVGTDEIGSQIVVVMPED